MRELVSPFLYRQHWSHHLRFELKSSTSSDGAHSSFTDRDLRRLASLPTKPVPHWLPLFQPKQVCTLTLASVELFSTEPYLNWSDLDDQSQRAWEDFLQKQARPLKLVVPWMPFYPPQNSWDILQTSSPIVTELVTHLLNCPAWFRLASLSNLASLTVTTRFLLSAYTHEPQPLPHLTHLRLDCRALTDDIPPFLQFTPNLVSLTLLHPTSFGSTPTSLWLSLTPALSSLSILLGSLPLSTAEARNTWMQPHLDDLFPLLSHSLRAPGTLFSPFEVQLVPHAAEDGDMWQWALAESAVKEQIARDPAMARVKSLEVVEAEQGS
ncbi:hypothetical protein JCM8097_005093 [Rhodosporidiobolus ruineniae]